MDSMHARVAALLEKGDVEALWRLLMDSDPEVQEAAWSAVEKRNSTCARSAITKVLDAPDATTRARALRWFAQNVGPELLPRVGPLVRDADPSVRRAAIRAISTMGEEALPHLAEGLEDTDPMLRRIATEAIARSRGPAAIEPLARASQDAEPAVRRIAVRSLAGRDHPAARDACFWKLFDGDFQVRGLAFGGVTKLDGRGRTDLLLLRCGEIRSRGFLAAADDIGALLREQSVEELARLVEVSLDGEERLVASGVWGLVRDELQRRADGACVALLRRGIEEGVADVRQGCLRALRQADSPEAQKALVGLAGHRDAEIRIGVVAELAARPFTAGTEALVRLLDDGVEGVRLAAVRALRKKPPEGWIDLLLGHVKDPVVEFRREVVEELGRFADRRAIDALVTTFGDPEVEVRRAAVRKLVARGLHDDRMVPTYLAALAWPFPDKDEEWGSTVRQKIVQWMGELGVKDALSVLAQVAGEDRVLLRRMAVEAILKIGGPEALRAVYKSPAPETETLAPVVEEPHLEMSAEEAQAILAKLTNMDDPSIILEPRARDALAAFRETPDKSILRKVALGLGRAQDPRGLIPLVRSLEECRGPMVHEARKLILRYPEHRSLAFLVQSLKSKWTSLRRFSAERLREETDMRALDPLLAAVEDEDSEVQCAVVGALANFTSDPRVSSKLLACISYSDISVRQSAIEALGNAKFQEAVPAIVAALQNPFLRARAETALRQIGDRKGILAVKRAKRREALFPKGRKVEEERKRRIKARGKPKP